MERSPFEHVPLSPRFQRGPAADLHDTRKLARANGDATTTKRICRKNRKLCGEGRQACDTPRRSRANAGPAWRRPSRITRHTRFAKCPVRNVPVWFQLSERVRACPQRACLVPACLSGSSVPCPQCACLVPEGSQRACLVPACLVPACVVWFQPVLGACHACRRQPCPRSVCLRFVTGVNSPISRSEHNVKLSCPVAAVRALLTQS